MKTTELDTVVLLSAFFFEWIPCNIPLSSIKWECYVHPSNPARAKWREAQSCIKI